MSSADFKIFNTVSALRITFPLMLAALSGNMMLFVGRFVLAKYDMHSMNAAASTVLVCNVFQIAGMSVTTMAEIFVGQYNGLQKFKKVPNAVWQMIWFSLGLLFVFLPIAFWGGEYLIANKFKALGLSYFQITMVFGFLVPLLGALASFFVGTGNTGPLIVSALIANVLNIILNIVLVFGYENIIQPRGAAGSALATGIALMVQVLFLFYAFISSENHRQFNTRRVVWDVEQLLACIKVGAPNAISRVIEITGWVVIVAYLSTVGDDYVTVQTLCHSLIIMFMFTVEGLSKGVTAMVANAIGRGAMSAIKQIIFSSVNILIFILVGAWVVLWAAPESTILKLMNQTQFINSGMVQQVSLAFKGLWVYFAFNGLSLIIWGVLTAGGDTKFIMWTNTISTWLFAIIPTYIWVAYFPSTASVTFQYIAPVYGFLAFIIVLKRFYSQKWLKINLNQIVTAI
ncbi:MAG: hypothetical protein H6492_02455 [Candidatus Paracaedibacteraceae bacterium]|nr:hypothetical protein [Candidatus Paracaedibacteraceae bacterium]